MLAVHEHEARPFLSALDDHDTQGPTLAHDDDVLRVLTLDERSWEEPDTAGAPLEEAPTSERGLNAADPETDQVLARYFGEVRQFALLSFAEEQALGRRIKTSSAQVELFPPETMEQKSAATAPLAETKTSTPKNGRV